jgi:putative pyruvate formate lyase activating enzyme
MSDLGRLRVWQDPAIRTALSWYLDVAENRRPAKFRIAATLATELDPALSAEKCALDRTRPYHPDFSRALAGDSCGRAIASSS